MAHFTSDAEIEHIGRGLLDCSLPKIEWTHAAHFAAAFWLLRRSGTHAARDMPKLIRAYNAATGVPNTDSSGYHETITLGSLRAARAWLATWRGILRSGDPMMAAIRVDGRCVIARHVQLMLSSHAWVIVVATMVPRLS